MKFDYRGRQYEDSVPVFVSVDDTHCYDRLLGRMVLKSSIGPHLDAAEIGDAPKTFHDANRAVTDYLGKQAEFDAVIEGVGTSQAVVTIIGGFSNAAGTATLVVDTGTGDQTINEAVTEGMSEDDLAQAFAANVITGGTLQGAGDRVIVTRDTGNVVKVTFGFVATP